jgi:predicted TPR repeat methyltransferase
VVGRRRAHATFSQADSPDATSGLAYAMDLTTLTSSMSADPSAYVGAMIDRFAEQVRSRITSIQMRND